MAKSARPLSATRGDDGGGDVAVAGDGGAGDECGGGGAVDARFTQRLCSVCLEHNLVFKNARISLCV